MEDPRERPTTTDDEIDRTGRDQQVAGLEAGDGPSGRPPGLDDDDAAEGGVDSADFPGAGAP
jgi:hypothetical protein